ncbi:MAG: hypothetical protein JWN02_1703 [Acidobacteria bacterium]|nr:hypothetical protein [Acidobacteriota bacterium]
MRPAFALAALLLLASVGMADDCTPPELLWRRVMDQPAWVAADVAFDARGDLRHDFFPNGAGDALDRNRAENADGRCHFFLGAVSEGFIHNRTLEELVDDSRAIVAGTLSGSRPGFYANEPGTLYTVTVAAILENDRHTIAPSGPLYLFQPQAEIPTPRGLICAHEPGTELLPIGTRIVAFANMAPIDQESRILQTDQDQQLFVERNATLIPPRAAPSSLIAPATYEELLARIHKCHPER